jgi:hypothetical protein
MRQYGGEFFEYPKAKVDNALVIKVEIEHMTGKWSG